MNLGAFLFLLYINDLPNCLETTNARLLADDTTLLATGLNTVEVETKLHHDLLNVDQWLKANKLTLNEGKTEFMIIGLKVTSSSFEQGPSIKLGDEVVKRVPHEKTLGVILDEQLKWDKHIKEQSKMISKSIALLRRAKPFVPRHAFEKMYNAFVIPNFYSCSTVWYDRSISNLTKMYK